MDRRLFQDLIVSAPAPPRSRHAALLPFSIALHGGVLALALLVPVLRPGEMPVPAFQRPIWEVSRVAPPPAIRSEPTVRVAQLAPVKAAGPAMRVTTPAVAPGPPVVPMEPDSLSVDADAPLPCVVNCDGPLGRGGTGDGPIGTMDRSDGIDAVGTHAVRPGGKIKAPVRTVYVAPAYPGIANAAGLSAVVVLECTIDPSGRVAEARVVSGHPLFNEAALSAVQRWRYTATLLNGVPVPVLMTVTVRFTARR